MVTDWWLLSLGGPMPKEKPSWKTPVNHFSGAKKIK